MTDLSFCEMQQIQRELQEKYKDIWEPISPKTGRNKLLWMIIEAGEVADIIKKEGDDAIMTDDETRAHFVEELCDVLMYLNDVLLCYDVSSKDLRETYLKKHKRNMERW